jgi:hypothetical protein
MVRPRWQCDPAHVVSIARSLNRHRAGVGKQALPKTIWLVGVSPTGRLKDRWRRAAQMSCRSKLLIVYAG